MNGNENVTIYRFRDLVCLSEEPTLVDVEFLVLGGFGASRVLGVRRAKCIFD
jgi:hypothetical protein